jgi:glycyl-tRNA synthetase beta chain
MIKHPLLIEIFTEELPPKALQKMSLAFQAELAEALTQANLSYTEIIPYATPRRLALKVEALSERQPNITQERKGPTLAAAYTTTGEPTPACLGFMKSAGATVEQLTAKDGYVYVTQHILGKTVDELLPELMPKVIARIPVPKRMRWGHHSEEFSRPVHHIILLYGPRVIPATILGLKASHETYGHRFHHPDPITVTDPSHYESLLFEAKVIADFSKRREAIKAQIDALAKKISATPMINPDLLDEVTGLVEWPCAILANFSERFLRVPSESLISAMEQHQKSFALLDKAGKLLPHFITISNIESTSKDVVKHGNEKVMHARLSDAEFFYQMDLKQTLTARINDLKNVIFQEQLGTLYDKSQRIAEMMEYFATEFSQNPDTATQAAMLAKTDLLTYMVKEFPELQGTMGYYYAIADKLPENIAIALKEHYLPRTATDKLPETQLGSLLAIADRVDTLIGIFGINKAPTGEKDPFALRRAALGILKICIENQLPIDILTVLQHSAKTYGNKLSDPNTIAHQAFAFIIERLRYLLAEQGISADIFAAVLAKNISNPLDFAKRAFALKHFKTLPEAAALASANKRVCRILDKENHQTHSNNIQTDLLQAAAEKALYQHLSDQKNMIMPYVQQQAYEEALTHLADLRVTIDQFFDNVLVVDENENIKNNRLNLLYALRTLFLEIGDISLLQ